MIGFCLGVVIAVVMDISGAGVAGRLLLHPVSMMPKANIVALKARQVF
jgi:hypothetical protein